MKILILEDNAYRHQVFAARYHMHQCTHCYSYLDFIDKFNQGGWDLIHLDHDLGEFSKPDTYQLWSGKEVEYNGMDAAMHIVKSQYAGEVIIHSVNPAGNNMRKQLLDTGRITVVWDPFTDVSLWNNDGV